MIDPVMPAAQFFKDFWDCMPTVCQSFVFLVFGLWVVNVIIHFIFR